jgi:hypothetical protein
MKMKASLSAVAVVSALLVTLPAVAQEAAQSSASQSAARGYAGISFGSPVAFGASWGNIGLGVYAQTIDNASEDYDGSAALVFGLGDPNRFIGIEAAVISSSLTDSRGSGDGFGEAGAMGFKIHTNLPDNAAIAIGVTGTGRFGGAADPGAGNSSSVYAVGTKVFSIGTDTFRRALVLNVGVGDNVFNDPAESGAGIFGSVALFVTKQISLVGDYTGRFVNVGLSVAPLRSVPLTIVAGAINVTERYGFDTQTGVTVGYGIQF